MPRESGVSDRPMRGAVPFASPESMRIEVELPHKGKVTGMGIPEGITVIVGGGYHGKSTLLKALEQGVYNHICGDGREYVVADNSGMKIRAEDGRNVLHTDISMFINHLPAGQDTTDFPQKMPVEVLLRQRILSRQLRREQVFYCWMRIRLRQTL